MKDKKVAERKRTFILSLYSIYLFFRPIEYLITFFTNY